MKFPILKLPPNRVRRNYRGGMGIDLLQGATHPADSDRPENWIASLVEAVNPGLPEVAGEGLAMVNPHNAPQLLKELISAQPEYYLGKEHIKKWGLSTGFLAKLLDSSMRLHIQAHPTREFAQKELGKPWGKFETYVILSVREGIEPYIFLGFQKPPTPDEWLRIVVEQDMEAMHACFEKVPVKPGEVWYVPGGLPHALGEGLTVLEVMEPSDLVVRCEFEREGIVVPPEARFMGQSPEEALRIFDFTEWSVSNLTETFRVTPTPLTKEAGYEESLLIGSEQIDSFEERRAVIEETVTKQTDGRFRIGFVNNGKGALTVGNSTIQVTKGDCFFIASEERQITYEPDKTLELLFCFPGIIV